MRKMGINSPKQKGKTERVWEIDALRGFLVLNTLWINLYLCLKQFCACGIYKNINPVAVLGRIDPLGLFFRVSELGISQGLLTGSWLGTWTFLGVDVYFVCSGLSCIFTRDNFKSTLRLLIGAVFVSIFTKTISIITNEPILFQRFGALHCYAACHFLYYYVFRNLKSRTLLICAIPVFAIGYYLRYAGIEPMRLPIFYIFGVPQLGDASGDYWPVFPMLGWLLVGVVLGRHFYADRKTLFPNAVKLKSILTPLRFMGKNTGYLYLGQMVLNYTVFYCIGMIWKLY